jgi:hypothetical protein
MKLIPGIGPCFLVAAAVVAACSPSSGASNGSDSGSPSEGGSLGPAGLVSFAQGGGPDGDAYTIVAAFDEASGTSGGGTSPCAAAVNGCTYCNSADDGGVNTGNLKISFLGAGTLTFNDDAKTLATLTYSQSVGAYDTSSVTKPSLAWAAGDTLSVSATGGAIPAFSASIQVPEPITGVSPAFSLEKDINVAPSGAFVIHWTPAADDGTMSMVLGYDVESHPGTIGCTAPQSAGTITVPASVMKELTGGAAGSGTISLVKTVSKPVSVTGASVKIQATGPQIGGGVAFM